MASIKQKNKFDKCGIALLSDLTDPVVADIYHDLEEKQEKFLSYEDKFRSKKYKWPKDALHWWSRIWEYPYVYYHLKRIIKNNNNKLKLVDVGTGVTFFPFAISDLGYKVECTDIDPVCVNDLKQAIKYSTLEYGSQVESHQIYDGRLPFDSDTIDVVTSVSVLEHIPDINNAISEINRVLKINGYLVLTLDLDIRGDEEIGIEKYYELLKILNKNYSLEFNEILFHPKDMLRPMNSTHPITNSERFFYIKRIIKAKLLYPIARRKIKKILPFDLAVAGLVLRKISD